MKKSICFDWKDLIECYRAENVVFVVAISNNIRYEYNIALIFNLYKIWKKLNFHGNLLKFYAWIFKIFLNLFSVRIWGKVWWNFKVSVSFESFNDVNSVENTFIWIFNFYNIVPPFYKFNVFGFKIKKKYV